MNWDIFWEVFGYIGSAMVLLSMLMTSVKWLRIFNMTGSVISTIYALATNAMPVAVLNIGLFIINSVQLWRLHRDKNKEEVK